MVDWYSYCWKVTLKGRKAGADRKEYGVTTLKNGPTAEPWEWPKCYLKISLPGRTWCTTFEFEEVTLIEHIEDLLYVLFIRNMSIRNMRLKVGNN